jgi:hypothetical protein
MFNEGNQIHNFISSSGSGTVINYGSGSGFDFLTSYGSGSGSTTLIRIRIRASDKCIRIRKAQKRADPDPDPRHSWKMVYFFINETSEIFGPLFHFICILMDKFILFPKNVTRKPFSVIIDRYFCVFCGSFSAWYRYLLYWYVLFRIILYVNKELRYSPPHSGVY